MICHYEKNTHNDKRKAHIAAIERPAHNLIED
jgi:hypothetical protein